MCVDEDFPENNPGNNYRRRTDERGNYGSPRQQQQSRGGGGYDRASSGQQQSLQSSQTKFKESIWKLGSSHDDQESYDPLEEIPKLAQEVEHWYFKDPSTVYLSFRAAVSELPHKLHHYASLLAHLSIKPVKKPISLASRISTTSTSTSTGLPPKPVTSIEESNEDEATTEQEEQEFVNVGKEIVEDLIKSFQSFLDERKWKSVRYSVILFSQLTCLPVQSPLIASTSLFTLLSSFLSVLDEPGLR